MAIHRYLSVFELTKVAILIGILLIGGIGYQIRIPVTLNNVWQSAIWSDLVNKPEELNAASIPVIVVL